MFCNIYRQVNIFLMLGLLCITAHGNAYADNTNYILTARQANLLKNMDRIADMVANVNTTGFKTESDIFTQLPKRTSSKEKLSFSTIGKSVRDYSQGGMVLTNRQFDVAINGKGYFQVNTPFGPMYTRNGSFSVSNEGVLINQDGYPVAGPSGGQTELTDKDVEISIKEDGLVKSGDEDRGQIGVFSFENENLLQRVGKGLFRTSQPGKVAENYKLSQGMLENSNVNSITSMTDLVTVSRNIEAVTKISDTHNEMQLDMIRKMTQ